MADEWKTLADYDTRWKVDTFNDYLIGATRETVLIGKPVMGYMSPEDALRLAAWLVVVAEPMNGIKFPSILKQIQES